MWSVLFSSKKTTYFLTGPPLGSQSKPKKTRPIFHPTSRFCHVGWNVGMVCAITKFIKFRKRRKKSCWMMLDEVCSRTKFHPTCFDAKVWIFHVGLVWRGVHTTFINFRWFRMFAHSNCNLNFLMCFRILNFVSITNIYCGWERHKTMY